MFLKKLLRVFLLFCLVFLVLSAENYKIKKGDSLLKISKKYHTTIKKIMEVNKIINKDDIKAGQTIQVLLDDIELLELQPTPKKKRIKKNVKVLAQTKKLKIKKIISCSEHAEKILDVYDEVIQCTPEEIIFKNGRRISYSSKKSNSFKKALEYSYLEDMFRDSYKEGIFVDPPKKDYDPGRYRNEKFFRFMYGNTLSEVKRHLTTISWFGRKVRVTKVNNVHRHLKAVEKDLRELVKQNPKFKKYLTPIGGTFSWRKIAGTNRLSVHSYGAAIDINVKYSAYWRWSKGKYKYQNKIPEKIIEKFEDHGFIWGGKWYHYDTMHFEYRPELFEYK